MWKGHCREAWDRVAALRHTMMQCGLSQPKRMPRVDELNPVRVAERDEMEDFDTFSDDMEKMILESIST